MHLGPHRRGERTSAVRVTLRAAICAALALAGCAADERGAPSAPAPGTAALSADGGPAVTILSPPNNTNFDVEAEADITVAVSVVDGLVGASDLHIEFYLDGVEEAELTAIAPLTFEGVPCGFHQIAARLVTADGEPLPNPDSVDTIFVRVRCPCTTTADCDDGNACSGQNCSVGLCSYGPIAGCCTHDLECPFGWLCEGDSCVQCGTSTDCDDGDVCTTDICTVDGLCEHLAVDGCCNVDLDCDDGLFCTTDTCDAGAHTCGHVDSPDPQCCNVTADCKPEDPCVKYICYVNSKFDTQWCRYGPPEWGCCTQDSHCEDGDPCSIDSCQFLDPDSDKGTCIYDPDPQKPNCCLSSAQCDDDDASTADVCVANACEHTPNPLYCELPTTSSMVINELQVAPSVAVGPAGEYIELYNASEDIIDVMGWTVLTSLGGVHTLTPGNTVGSTFVTVLVPDVYFVMGREADKALNGGFVPHYQYGDDIALPDPWETGGPVTFSITLLDADGAVVDELTYDSGTWPLEERRALELTHPWADNSLPQSWRASGYSSSVSMNTPYGTKSYGLHGSPKTKNKSSLLGILHDACVVPGDGSVCAEGRCNMDSTCEFPIAESCCTSDSDCEDGSPCTVPSCDVANTTCVDVGQVPGCCVSDAECEDASPCNIDRCIGNTCRYSPDIIPNCCVADVACEDGDPCTINTCDVDATQCFAPIPVQLGGGLQCCATADDCDDGISSTLNLCDPTSNICIFPPDTEFCSAPSDPCDDDDPCTADACDVGAQTCQHVAEAGCCSQDGDCADDGDVCTDEVCDLLSNTCGAVPVDGCCNVDGECDDTVLCTADTCVNHVCHNTDIPQCCEGDGDCDDLSDCTSDACDTGANTCEYTSTGQCCTPGADPGQLANECGVDPDGPALLCWTWTCTVDAACEAVQAADCCAEHVDCDDQDGCTVDVCQSTGLCKHIENTNDTNCCADHSECESTDYCEEGQCAPKLPDGEDCAEAVECESGICEGGLCVPPETILTYEFSGLGLVSEEPDGTLVVLSIDGGPGGRQVGTSHTVDWGTIQVD